MFLFFIYDFEIYQHSHHRDSPHGTRGNEENHFFFVGIYFHCADKIPDFSEVIKLSAHDEQSTRLCITEIQINAAGKASGNFAVMT